ncbi:hypothetical protein GCM10010530_15910 [Kribbella aluminosa]
MDRANGEHHPDDQQDCTHRAEELAQHRPPSLVPAGTTRTDHEWWVRSHIRTFTPWQLGKI